MSVIGQDGNGWIEYRALVLSELERLDVTLKERHTEARSQLVDVEDKLLHKLHNIANNQQVMHGQIVALQVKAGVWGALAGFIPALGVFFLK